MIYYVTVCVPVEAESQEQAFSIGNSLIEHARMVEPTDDNFAEVVSVERKVIEG
jgi:hypothetical protein